MSRLTIATSAQADASGGVTFDGFGAPGTGTAWVVTAAVPLAPGTASFQAWRTTEVWASWLGSAAGGPLLVTGSQRLIVKGTSLTKTTIYRCVLTGQSMPEATAQGVSVAPISSSTLTKTTFSGAVKITGPVSFAAGSQVAVNAGQLSSTGIPLQATAPQLLVTTFGTGTTGTVTITAAATLTHVANYVTLTVDAVLTSPWEVFCSVEATGTGTIANNGHTGVNSATPVAGALAGTFYGGGGGHTPNAPTADFTGAAGGPGYYNGTTFEPGGTAGNPLRGTLLYNTVLTYTLSGGAAGGKGESAGTAGSGAGVVMVVAKKVSGGLTITANGGNGRRVTSGNYGGGGGGGIALLYSHTTVTWTGSVKALPGTTVTQPSASGGTGSKIVRKKYTGALYP